MDAGRLLRRTLILSLWSLFFHGFGIGSQNQEEPLESEAARLPVISDENLMRLRNSMGHFSTIPVDLFDRHLTPILPAYVMCLNKAFFMLITGFKDDQVCSTGVRTGLSFKVSHCLTTAYAVTDFNPETISSVFWYVLLREAVNLPSNVWPFLKNSRIKILSLRGSKIDNSKAVLLARSLQNTGVEKIDLYWNQIDNEGAKEFAENLPLDSNVKEVILTKNNLKCGQGVDFVRAFHQAGVRRVHVDSSLKKVIGPCLEACPTTTVWKFVWDIRF